MDGIARRRHPTSSPQCSGVVGVAMVPLLMASGFATMPGRRRWCRREAITDGVRARLTLARIYVKLMKKENKSMKKKVL